MIATLVGPSFFGELVKKYIVPLFVTLLIAGSYLCFESHESTSREKTEFAIDKPYINVVKALATKNSLEKIVQESDGTVTQKNWENFNIEVPKRILRLKEYTVDGTLKFVVEKTDHDLGEIKLPFAQQIHLESHIFSISTKLVDPQPKVCLYNKLVEISPLVEEDMPKTHVCITSELKIRKTIPFFFKKYMDDKVAQTNKKDMEQLKANILDVSNQKNLITLKINAQSR